MDAAELAKKTKEASFSRSRTRQHRKRPQARLRDETAARVRARTSTLVASPIMLLEVSTPADAEGAAENFICDVSVRLSVGTAVEHVARLLGLRANLAAAVAAATSEPAGANKRAHNSEALADASALLCPLGIDDRS